MSGRESAAVSAAVADVLAGVTRTEAARRHGVSESSIYRMMRRKGAPALKPGPRRKPLPALPEPYRYADGSPLVATP